MTPKATPADDTQSNDDREGDASSDNESNAETTSHRSRDDASTHTSTDEDDGAEIPPLHKLLLGVADGNHPTSEASLEQLRLFLKEKPSEINDPGPNSMTALHVAAEKGLVKEAELLIKAGANVSVQDVDGEQPLHLACREGHINLVTLLLDNDAKVDALSEDKTTPFYLASRYGHLSVVELLLENNANTQVIESEGWTPLIQCSYKGHEKLVKRLLEVNKSNIDRTEKNEHWTALNAAIYSGNKEIASLLLHNGASISIKDSAGWTPLMTATIKHHTNIVTMLLDTYPEVTKTLLEEPDETGRTPLYVASSEGFLDIVSVLVTNGANCDRVWKWKEVDTEIWRTPLHIAILESHTAIAYYLLPKASVVAKTNDGKTALHLASEMGNATIVEWLIGYKVSVDAKDDNHATALHLASGAKAAKELDAESHTGQHLAVVNLLLSNGAQASLCSKSGETALHCAAKRGDKERLASILPYMEENDLKSGTWKESAVYLALKGDNPESALEFLLGNDTFKEAEFWKSVERIQVIEEVADAKTDKPKDVVDLIFQHLPSSEGREPKGSDHWSAMQWAAHQRLPELLSKLIEKSKEADLMADSALELVSENMLSGELEDDKSCRKLSEVLSRLIVASEGTSKNVIAVKRAHKKVKDHKLLIGQKVKQDTKDNQGQQPFQAKIRAQGRASGKSKGSLDPHDSGSTPWKQETRISRYVAILEDILRDPPFAQMAQTHTDKREYDPPIATGSHKVMVKKTKATVVGFFKRKNQTGRIRRNRPIQELIYDDVPTNVVGTAIQDLIKMTGAGSTLFNGKLYTRKNLNFTWMHLPSTNMAWMNDALTSTMYHDGYKTRGYYEVRSFFRDSWIEVPDKESQSRIMRPRAVDRPPDKKREGTKTKTSEPGVELPKDAKRNKQKVEEEEEVEENKKSENKKKPQVELKDSNEQEEWNIKRSQLTEKPHQFVPASAIYMPYFTYSTHCQNYESLGNDQNDFKQANRDYDELLEEYKNMHQHGSPTLDEWYYQFAKKDTDAAQDQNTRNESQVVSKYLQEGKKNDGKRKAGEACQWTVVRVNQLWIWTITEDWIITATSSSFNGNPDILVDEVLDQLSKQAEYGGSSSQPVSAAELVPVIVDYCIGSYERRPKDEGRVSIGQSFSHYINRIGRDETTLFDDFRCLTPEDQPSTKEKNNGKKSSSVEEPPKNDAGGENKTTAASGPAQPSESTQHSHSEEISKAIKKAKDLYYDIKDVRDELNILKSVAHFQQIVQRGIAREQGDDSRFSATYVVKDLEELDSIADRIQSAINTTLSLQQSEVANSQAVLATKQGKTVMVFTFATVLFLPLSFLSSLFALDVASFKQAPAWAFYVIFFVSFAISVILASVISHWDKIKKFKKRVVNRTSPISNSRSENTPGPPKANETNIAKVNTRENVAHTPREFKKAKSYHLGFLSPFLGNELKRKQSSSNC